MTIDHIPPLGSEHHSHRQHKFPAPKTTNNSSDHGNTTHEDRDTTRRDENNVINLVWEQASTHPNNVALIDECHTLSYHQFAKKSHQLAAYLLAQGISAEDTIAIYCHRSCEMIIAIAATLTAGAAFIPLDPTWPKLRQESILRQSNCTFITHHRTRDV